jgi:hypothetical protein
VPCTFLATKDLNKLALNEILIHSLDHLSSLKFHALFWALGTQQLVLQCTLFSAHFPTRLKIAHAWTIDRPDVGVVKKMRTCYKPEWTESENDPVKK